MKQNKFIPAGIITSTHGLRGEVKVYPTLDDPGRFSLFKKVRLEKDGKVFEEEVEKARYFKNMVIVKWKGIDTIEDVMKYRGYNILVTREEAADLKENQYFELDLIGLEVITDEGVFLGTLKKIIHTGANDVYVVGLDSGKELLIPAIKQCILDVNIEESTILVHVLPGLEPQ